MWVQGAGKTTNLDAGRLIRAIDSDATRQKPIPHGCRTYSASHSLYPYLLVHCVPLFYRIAHRFFTTPRVDLPF